MVKKKGEGKGAADDISLVSRIWRVGSKSPPDEIIKDPQGKWHIIGYFVTHDRRGKWGVSIGDVSEEKLYDETFIPNKLTRAASLPKDFASMNPQIQQVEIAKAYFVAQHRVKDDKKFMWRFFFLLIILACIGVTGIPVLLKFFGS